MKFIGVLLTLFLFSVVTYSQSKKIVTEDVSKVNYYPDIIYLNEGEPSANGRIYRVIITLSEVYNGLIIEALTVGDEGGNAKVISKRRVDLNALWSDLHISSEAGLSFGKWVTPTSFTLKIYNRKFLIKDANSSTITITAL